MLIKEIKDLKQELVMIREKIIRKKCSGHYVDFNIEKWNDVADPLDYVLMCLDKILDDDGNTYLEN